MTISEQTPDSDATFLRHGEGELAVVFAVSATEALAADQTVFHDRAHPSHVLLPVVPR
jgi:hypothetical protein